MHMKCLSYFLFLFVALSFPGATSRGESAVNVVDPSTLNGKVMCGYQGWFTAEGDGSRMGWTHYSGRRGLAPGSCTFDLWPDLSDMDEDEKYPTAFRHTDGSVANLFSPSNRKTVGRHFAWMRDYKIDGVFLQRFGVSVCSARGRNQRNLVMDNVRAGAAANGRVWAMMYDLSGLREGDIERTVMADWRRLVDESKILKDKTYLHHDGKPVVAVWGVGFNDGRRYTLDECVALVRFLKDDPKYGGNTVMLGVPTGWRTLDRDCLRDEKVHEAIQLADIVSPWTVGRYNSPAEVASHGQKITKPDLAWCEKEKKDYLPVIYPGFSWHNMHVARGENARLDQIPRLGGRFLWAQGAAGLQAGAKMVYVAMFDEIDEGTAIFKCTNTPPVGDSPFLTYQGEKSDHYLWLTGQIGQMLKGERVAETTMPKR